MDERMNVYKLDEWMDGQVGGQTDGWTVRCGEQLDK